jgi:hypothetical protein
MMRGERLGPERVKSWGRFVWRLLKNQRGELVGSLGWMAVTTAVLALIHGLLTGWLPDFVGRIFVRLEMLV